MSLIPNRTKLAAMRFRWRLASRPSATGESAGTWGLLPTQRADFGRCARSLLSELPDGGYVALERLDVYADGYSIAEVIAFAGSLDAMRAHGVTPAGVNLVDWSEGVEQDGESFYDTQEEAELRLERSGYQVVLEDDDGANYLDSLGASAYLQRAAPGCRCSIGWNLPGGPR
jgi:hypothetical protein